MSLMPMYKTCRICGKKYSFNPDVGQMFCPYCASSRNSKLAKKLKKILGHIDDDKSDFRHF